MIPRGAVPKKLLVYGASFEAEFRDAVGFGWDHGEKMPEFSWERLISAKTDEIERLNGIYGRILDNAGVEKFEGAGRVVGPHEVEVTAADGTKKTYTAKNILLAPGGRAWYPSIPGADLGITSDEALALQSQPKRVLVIGGGYIAVEFAGIFSGLGSETKIAYRADLPLRGFDEEVRSTVATNLEARDIEVMAKVTPVSVTKNDDGSLSVEMDNGETVVTDCLMWATGRVPNTDRPDLGLKEVGVELDAKGAVKVDEYSQTTVDSIWAVRPRHKPRQPHPRGAHGGHGVQGHGGAGQAYQARLREHPQRGVLPAPVATWGRTEAQAIDAGLTCDAYTSTFTPMKISLAGRVEKAFMKLIVDVATDKVVGATWLGPTARRSCRVSALRSSAAPPRSSLTPPWASTPPPPRSSSPCAKPLVASGPARMPSCERGAAERTFERRNARARKYGSSARRPPPLCDLSFHPLARENQRQPLPSRLTSRSAPLRDRSASLSLSPSSLNFPDATAALNGPTRRRSRSPWRRRSSPETASPPNTERDETVVDPLCPRYSTVSSPPPRRPTSPHRARDRTSRTPSPAP